MKIALIDNMNNNFFAFSRYLRDLGVDAHLYLIPNSKYDHFLPQADTYQDVSKMDWIHNFPVNIDAKTNFFLPKQKIRDEFLNRYDLIISCGLSSAFLKKAGIQSDIIVPYGSDLYDISLMDLDRSIRGILRNLYWYKLGYYQRKAYKEARVVIVNIEHGRYQEAIDRLGIDIINTIIPMIYNKEDIPLERSDKFNFLKDYDFILFNHARQEWCTPGTDKGNDRIIKAFAKFIKTTKFKKPLLVLFEYGSDVECSKRLIKELNIEDYVKWMPKSYRKEILIGLKSADFATDQIKENMAGTGSTANEALAMGVPLLTHTNGAIDDKSSIFYNAPLIDVLTIDDIVNVLKDYEENPNRYKSIGNRAKEWFDEHLGVGLAKRYKRLFKILIKDKNLTQKDQIVKDIFEK